MQKLSTALVLILFFLISCQNEKLNYSSPAPELYSFNQLEIDLLELADKKLFPKETTVSIAYDHIFKKEKNYLGYSLNEVLKPYLEKLDTAVLAHTKIKLSCVDGYAPVHALADILAHEGYIVYKDLEAKAESFWIDSLKSKLEPFCIVWGNMPYDQKQMQWPYALDKILIDTTSNLYEKITPIGDKMALKGFEQFKKQCIKCHSVNQLGGTLGPELNYPKSILDYWDKEDIWSYSKDPQSYRYNAKMHKMRALTREEFEEIIVYLEWMKGVSL